MNSLSIAGNVGNVRKGEHNGKPVLNFSVAVNEGRDRTTWFDCALWGDRVNGVGQYIQTGGKVAVVGSVSARTYTKGNGDVTASLDVFVRDVTLMGSKGDAQQPAQQQPVSAPDQLGGDEVDDEIPF